MFKRYCIKKSRRAHSLSNLFALMRAQLVFTAALDYLIPAMDYLIPAMVPYAWPAISYSYRVNKSLVVSYGCIC